MKVNEIKEGVKVGGLTAIRPWGHNKQWNQYWLFHCECGNDRPILIPKVGEMTTCGHCGTSSVDLHDSRKGAPYKSLWSTYNNMRNRCYRENIPNFVDYGGRGIKVCDEWRLSYSAFKKWAVENGYDYQLSIKEQSLDRIDVDGDYCPENCRWVDMKTQGRNKRNTVYILFNNEYTPLIEVAEKVNIPYKTLHKRYISGVRGDNLIAPIDKFVQKLKKYSIGDKMMTVREISQKYNISEPAVRQKIFKNTLNELERGKRK